MFWRNSVRLRTELILFGFIAIIIGSFLALPLLYSNIPHTHKAANYVVGYLNSEVVYGYFSTRPINDNAWLLWKTINSSEIPMQNITQTFYYFLVNVTNNSNATINMNSIEVIAAEFVNITDLYPGQTQEIRNPFLEPVTLLSGNAVFPNGADTSPIWNPHESRLIAVSGINGIRNLTNLESGIFYLGCNAYGIALPSNNTMLGGSSKQVQVQVSGNQYVYTTFSENLTISMDPTQGLEAHLNTGGDTG
jgi:hypothetical protein